LITGAFAERIRFGPICYSWFFLFYWFMPMSYDLAWRIIFQDGVLDFAGGTVVHMSAGYGIREQCF
jgi:Amt family ammonium transporter